MEKTAKRSGRTSITAPPEPVLGSSLWKDSELAGNSGKFVLRITLFPVDTRFSYEPTGFLQLIRPTPILVFALR